MWWFNFFLIFWYIWHFASICDYFWTPPDFVRVMIGTDYRIASTIIGSGNRQTSEWFCKHMKIHSFFILTLLLYFFILFLYLYIHVAFVLFFFAILNRWNMYVLMLWYLFVYLFRFHIIRTYQNDCSIPRMMVMCSDAVLVFVCAYVVVSVCFFIFYFSDSTTYAHTRNSEDGGDSFWCSFGLFLLVDGTCMCLCCGICLFFYFLFFRFHHIRTYQKFWRWWWCLLMQFWFIFVVRWHMYVVMLWCLFGLLFYLEFFQTPHHTHIPSGCSILDIFMELSDNGNDWFW